MPEPVLGSGGAGAKDSVPASEELRAPSGGEGQCAHSVEVTHAAERALAVGEKDPHGPRVLVLRPRACRLVSLNRRRLICKTGNFFFLRLVRVGTRSKIPPWQD